MEAKKFILAGKAIFTVTSRRTGERFTYKVQSKKGCQKTGPWFVSVLTGQDNENDYKFFGTIFPELDFVHSKWNAKIGRSAPSVQGFDWFWRNIDNTEKMERVSVCHCGKCGRCGRLLTVPSSVESGFGPECINLI